MELERVTPELHALMKTWLESEHEHERRHAAHRLSMPDALEFERTGQNTVIAYPSLAEMAASAVSAAAGFAASGFAVTDEAERDRRLAICRGCEFFVRDDGRCLKCGCNLGFKVRIAAAHCPIDKW